MMVNEKYVLHLSANRKNPWKIDLYVKMSYMSEEKSVKTIF